MILVRNYVEKKIKLAREMVEFLNGELAKENTSRAYREEVLSLKYRILNDIATYRTELDELQ